MRLQKDVQTPNIWRVLNAKGYIGIIHGVGPDEWRNRVQ